MRIPKLHAFGEVAFSAIHFHQLARGRPWRWSYCGLIRAYRRLHDMLARPVTDRASGVQARVRDCEGKYYYQRLVYIVYAIKWERAVLLYQGGDSMVRLNTNGFSTRPSCVGARSCAGILVLAAIKLHEGRLQPDWGDPGAGMSGITETLIEILVTDDECSVLYEGMWLDTRTKCGDLYTGQRHFTGGVFISWVEGSKKIMRRTAWEILRTRRNAPMVIGLLPCCQMSDGGALCISFADAINDLIIGSLVDEDFENSSKPSACRAMSRKPLFPALHQLRYDNRSGRVTAASALVKAFIAVAQVLEGGGLGVVLVLDREKYVEKPPEEILAAISGF
ncbi:hypothetical protein EDB85DRAFT_1892315 [Lactarius pseudohatsudake]|nr:hypothetical protein EDB85DRAFT_1892315 [Lactarius pseudohatsudake]